ncbi:hypothetical protein BJ875DRAFT_464339 [Amylocarpus encephaloides]|uniref:Uncharacterized protein n=1 Tax=Amylocarpus encephaloides TaxID=45428 RepID=A0A9P8C4Q1_9HELO|nr:hypothetical protein BJ875DRAFT_464339 [Amylocarpus encephaloides]
MEATSLKSWFAPTVKPVDEEAQPAWVEVDARGNEHVRKWQRPKRKDPWDAWSDYRVGVTAKYYPIFFPMIVLPLVAGFWHPMQKPKDCYQGRNGYVCNPIDNWYFFTTKHLVLIISGFYFLAAMILEIVLMSKRRLHPWMYTLIHVIGAIFPFLLFPVDTMPLFHWLTWTFACIQWAICLMSILHAGLVARDLARYRRSERQVEADAVIAERLYQDDERAAREGELLDIAQAINESEGADGVDHSTSEEQTIDSDQQAA